MYMGFLQGLYRPTSYSLKIKYIFTDYGREIYIKVSFENKEDF